MNTPPVPQDEQNATKVIDPLNDKVVLPPVLEESEVYYTYEDEEPNAQDLRLATPFGVSQEMPSVSVGEPSSDRVTPAAPMAPGKSADKPRISFTLIAIIVCVVVVFGFLVMSALAQPTPPMEMRQNPPAPVNQPAKTQGPTPTQAPTNPNPPPGNEVPQKLPAGWVNAGLTTTDAVEAQHTAMAFTDREMSLDFRSAGTRANHGGTFTAATFLLTPAGKQRFMQSDVRAINNTLWDKVQQEHLVQSVVDAQPQLAQFTQQGQQQLAWVDVSFHLWQSKGNGNAAPTEGFDTDPATNQPRVHHLMVLLLRVPPQNAGANSAMGGTGWLVSTYALDLPTGTMLNIATPA